jgi:predicted DNA-binding transcriptional regulator YafY
MRASRLLSILLQLQTHGRATAGRLAEQFEVSVRTVYRDIDHLSEAGVPVCSDRGRSGGFRLLDGFRSQLTGLTPLEAETLFFAGLPGPATELGLAELLASARIKLLAAVPAGAKAERLSTRFHLDPLGWFRAAENSILLPVIARATWADHQLDIRYRNSGAIVERRICPLGLVLKGGIWYLVAQRGSHLRTYRVSAVVGATDLERTFARPKGFLLPAHWAKTAQDYEANTYRIKAAVRLSPRGLSRVGMLGDHVARTVARTSRAADKEGWVACTLPLEGLDEGIRELLRLRDDVQVQAPRYLRRAMSRALATLSASYPADSRPAPRPASRPRRSPGRRRTRA